jgi:hypothetical protein
MVKSRQIEPISEGGSLIRKRPTTLAGDRSPL